MVLKNYGVTQPPARYGLVHGLMSVVDFRPINLRWEGGVVFEDSPCEGLQSVVDPCIGGEEDGEDAKDVFTPLDYLPSQIEAAPFEVYSQLKLPLAYGVDQANAKAREQFIIWEEAAVENAVQTGALGNVPNLSQANVIEGSFDQVTGIATLEQSLVSEYGSQGVLHMPVYTASILLSEDVLTVTSGNMLKTKLGTPVVAGAGYVNVSPSGEVPDLSKLWVYSSGSMFIYRQSDPVVIDAEAVSELSKNNIYPTVSRRYVVGFEKCGLHALALERK